MKFRLSLVVVAVVAMLAPVLFSAQVDAQTPIDVPCKYNELIAGCRRQILYQDTLPPGAEGYSGVVNTPDGQREAECVQLNHYQTVCVLGILIPQIDPGPVNSDPCDDNESLVTTNSGDVVCEDDTGAPPEPATPAPAPFPTFAA